jgi:poly(hydroxyalkanoate) depolymerase family esterase
MTDTPPPPAIVTESARPAEGEFLTREIESADGVRRYKIYVPSSYDKTKPLPLIVVLHGCTQDPDDIARGTRFNTLAEERGFLVAYPEQPQRANGLKCWNWFDAAHQKRGQGEPALIAAITQRVIGDYSVDQKRVFIAGLSAGGAMALIAAYAYPEIFHAAGIHSGVAYAAATSLADALAVMHGGARDPAALPRAVVSAMGASPRLPAIIFQGRADKSVDVINSSQIVSQLTSARTPTSVALMTEAKATGPEGYHYSRKIYGNGGPVIEEWIVDELGHAWSGGSKEGTYTDPRGPDATREMVRFFFQTPRT